MLLYAIMLKTLKSNHVFPMFFFYCVIAGVDFSIQVLSSGSWPFQQSVGFNLPVEVLLHNFYIHPFHFYTKLE